MRRRRASFLAAMLIASLLLVACSKATPAKSPAKEKRTLRVGVLFTTSGAGGSLAQAVLGASALVKDRAKSSNVELEIVQLDYAGNVARIPALIADAKTKADAILVGTSDPAAEPALRAEREIPILYPLLSDDSLINGATNAFRFGPSNKLQAEALIAFLAEHRKYKKIGILSDSTDFGTEGRADLASAMTSAGLTPVMDRTFDLGGDIHTPVAYAGQLKTDALVVWTASESEAARIVVEVHKMNFAYQLALSGNLATSTFAKSASAQVTPVAFRDGILSVGPWAGPWFRLKRINSFYTKFQLENSALAPVQAASVYDAVLALVHAARSTGTTASDLISGLESLNDFAGAGVPLTFGPDKHEGMDPDDIAMWAFTKNQQSAGGALFPEVDTGGGFFTILHSSLNLPKDLRYLAGYEPASSPAEGTSP